MSTDELAGCPKCGVGPGVMKWNLSPAEWIECSSCGFHLSAWPSTWAELVSLRTPAPDQAVEPAADGPGEGDVERVARAIYEASQPFASVGADVPKWSVMQKQVWNTIARAAIAALSTDSP